MKPTLQGILVWLGAAGLAASALPKACAQPLQSPAQLAEARKALEDEMESVAIVERKVMVPMRDGKRMAADIYRPKDTSKKYPIIFVRTPYNFNYWDVKNGVPADMKTPLDAVKRGYAYVEMNERGHFFSEGSLRHSGPAADGWLRRHYLDVVAALVERQGGDHRVLVDGGMATGRRGAGKSGVRGHDPARLRRGRGPRGTVLRAGQLVSRRRGADAVHRLALRRAEHRCGRCFRPTLRRKI